MRQEKVLFAKANSNNNNSNFVNKTFFNEFPSWGSARRMGRRKAQLKVLPRKKCVCVCVCVCAEQKESIINCTFHDIVLPGPASSEQQAEVPFHCCFLAFTTLLFTLDSSHFSFSFLFQQKQRQNGN